MISDFHQSSDQISFQAVKKGLRCPSCRAISEFNSHQRLFLCLSCRSIISVDQLFIQAAKEYLLIYPDRKMTKSAMYQWCNKKIPPAKIALLLKQHFKNEGRTKGTHYLELNIP